MFSIKTTKNDYIEQKLKEAESKNSLDDHFTSFLSKLLHDEIESIRIRQQKIRTKSETREKKLRIYQESIPPLEACLKHYHYNASNWLTICAQVLTELAREVNFNVDDCIQAFQESMPKPIIHEFKRK